MHLWFLVRSHVRRQHVNNVLKQTFLRRFNSDTPKQPEKKTNQWIRPENLTIPNMITVSRIISSPILGWAIMNDQKELAFGGCIIFGFSDWLDGYLAKKLNQRTVLGAFLDPFADKCMIGSLAVGLMYKGLLPVELVGLMIGRDACLIISSFAYRTLYKPPDVEFFDTSNTTNFVVEPSVLSKINTVTQFALLGMTLCHFSVGNPSLAVLEPMWWITGGTTILSGLGYLDGSGIKQFAQEVKKKAKQSSGL